MLVGVSMYAQVSIDGNQGSLVASHGVDRDGTKFTHGAKRACRSNLRVVYEYQ